MRDNLDQLQKIKKIVEVRRISITDKSKKLWGPEITKIAEKNSKKLFVYRMTYLSGGKKVIGFIVEPKKGKNLPCIIWNRGGSRDFGMILKWKLFAGNTIPLLALNGYIVIATQYPGNDGGEGLDRMGSEEDIVSVLDLYKILKSYQRADASRIGMYGHSRGGMMTYMCLPRASWIKSVVIGAAPTNEVTASVFRDGWLEHQKKMYGGSILERKKRSASLWVNTFPKKTPILLMHGTADWRVNPLDSLRIAEQFQKHKIPYRLIMYEGADHGITEFSKETSEETLKWFNRFVKNKEKLPQMTPHGV